MKKLYSSTFISIILGFIGFIGSQNQEIILVQDQKIPTFTNIIKPEIAQEQGESSHHDGQADLMSLPLILNIEYFDKTNCKNCDDFVINTLPKLKEKYLNESWVNFHVYFTPDTSNEAEMKAIMGAKCSASQNKFWEMHTAIHSGEKTFGKWFYQEFSKIQEMDIETFHECLVGEKHLNAINNDIEYAKEYGINDSPALIINDYKLIGYQPIENIEMIIDEIIMNHNL